MSVYGQPPTRGSLGGQVSPPPYYLTGYSTPPVRGTLGGGTPAAGVYELGGPAVVQASSAPNSLGLLALVAAVWLLVQTSAQRRTRRSTARNPYNPRRRRPGAGQLELPEAPEAYPVFSVGGGGMLPGRKKAPYWVIVQWAGVPSSDLRWFSHSVGRYSSAAAAADAARELAASEGGVYASSREAKRGLLTNRNPYSRPRSTRSTSLESRLHALGRLYNSERDQRRRADYLAEFLAVATELRRRGKTPRQLGLFNPRPNVWAQRRGANPTQCCRCGSGYPCRPNPYTQACRLGSGHVWDFRSGGRCQCCGRMAPKRLVTVEWDGGEQTNYGRTCAGRAIGTTKLRTNQLEHFDRQEAEQEARERLYRGVPRGRMVESGIERPPYAWARGLSLRSLTQIARDAGVSPYTYGWWDSANLVPGGREMQYRQGVGVSVKRKRSGEYVGAVLEGGHRSDQRRSSRSTAPAAPRGRGRTTSSRRRSSAYVVPGSDLPF